MARDFGEYAAGSRVVGAVDYRNLGDYVRKTQAAEQPRRKKRATGWGFRSHKRLAPIRPRALWTTPDRDGGM